MLGVLADERGLGGSCGPGSIVVESEPEVNETTINEKEIYSTLVLTRK